MNRDDKALLREMGRNRKGVATLRYPMNQSSSEWLRVRAAKRLCAAGLAVMVNRVTVRLTREGCALVRELRDQRLDQNQTRMPSAE